MNILKALIQLKNISKTSFDFFKIPIYVEILRNANSTFFQSTYTHIVLPETQDYLLFQNQAKAINEN